MKWLFMICYVGIILVLVIVLRRKMRSHRKTVEGLESFEDRFDELFAK